MYEIFEHTADLGIRAEADRLDELFAEAARGLFAVMVENLDAVQAVQQTTFQIEGRDLDALMHDWLAELLFTFHARRLALARFQVHVGPQGLAATAWGEPLNPARHRIDVEVKAITWHGLTVRQIGSIWTAEVIVDV